MKYALINKTIAQIRKEPDKNSELTDEALYGMKVELIDKVNLEWYLIKTHYNYTGYIHKSQLLIDGDKISAWKNYNKKVIKHSYADVLSQPKVQAIILISLDKGAVISVLSNPDSNGWVKVGLCSGAEGYVKEKFLGDYITTWSPKNEEALRRDIVNTALSYLGTQYRWGGRSPLGIDCSGLCSEAYMLNGVIIYRDADIKEGFPVHPIEYDSIKPADLLYFPGHVAMYIGNNKYVHSTGKNGSDGVVINSLNPEDEDYREDLPKILKAVGSIF